MVFSEDIVINHNSHELIVKKHGEISNDTPEEGEGTGKQGTMAVRGVHIEDL
jgi:hypothetical protein